LAGVIEPERLRWRRDKIDVLFEGNLKDFTEQYPRTLDECFQATGHGFFPKVNYVPTAEWRKRGALLSALGDHPMPGHSYAIGADVSAGVGRDYSIGEVVDLDLVEQVAEWASDGIDPDLFGLELAHLGGMFNKAYIVVEQNNHGLTTIRSLLDHYEHHLVHRGRPGAKGSDYETGDLMGYGTLVGERIKGSILGGLRSALRGELVIHSSLLKNELNSFVEKENGKLEAEEGCHDDRVMALAHAVSVVEQASLMVSPTRHRETMAPAWNSWEAIFGDLEYAREGGLPFTAGKWG